MQKKNIFFRLFFFAPEKKVIFARFFATASVRSRSLDQPLVPGVFINLLSMPGVKTKICIKPEDKSISARIENEGAWEGSTVSLVLKAVSKYPDAVFLDVGSNIGNMKGYLTSN